MEENKKTSSKTSTITKKVQQAQLKELKKPLVVLQKNQQQLLREKLLLIVKKHQQQLKVQLLNKLKTKLQIKSVIQLV